MFNRHRIFVVIVIIFAGFSGQLLHAAKTATSNSNYLDALNQINGSTKSVSKKINALSLLLDDLMGNQSLDQVTRGSFFNEVSTELKRLIAKRRAKAGGNDGVNDATLDTLTSKIDAYQTAFDQQSGRNGTFSRIKKIFFNKKTWYVVGGVIVGVAVLAAAAKALNNDHADDENSSSDDGAAAAAAAADGGSDFHSDLNHSGGAVAFSASMPDHTPPSQPSYFSPHNSGRSSSFSAAPSFQASSYSSQQREFESSPVAASVPLSYEPVEPPVLSDQSRSYSPSPTLPTPVIPSFTRPILSSQPTPTRPFSAATSSTRTSSLRPPPPTRMPPARPTATPPRPSFSTTEDSAEKKRKAEADREAREKNTALDKLVRSEGYKGFMAWKKENVCYDDEIKNSGNTYYVHIFTQLKRVLGANSFIYHSSRDDFKKYTVEELGEIEGHMKILSDARKQLAQARKDKEEADKKLKREQAEERQRKADEQQKNIADFIADHRSKNFATWANGSLAKDRLWFTDAERAQLSEIEDILRVKVCQKPEAMIASLLASPTRAPEFIGSDVRLLRQMGLLLKIKDGIPTRRDNAVKIRQLLEKDVVKDFFEEAKRRSYNLQDFGSELDRHSKNGFTRLNGHLNSMNEESLRGLLEKNIGRIDEITSIFNDMTKHFEELRELRRKAADDLSDTIRHTDT